MDEITGNNSSKPNRIDKGVMGAGRFTYGSLGEAIDQRGSLADIGKMAENLAEDLINDYDRVEARLNLTDHKKEAAFKTYLNAAADHDQNLLRAIGRWAGSEHADATTVGIDSNGELWLQKAEGKPVQPPARLTEGLTKNHEIFESGSVPVEVLRNIEWITDQELIEVEADDTISLDSFTDDVFTQVELSRDMDGALTLSFESPLQLAGILAQQGHDLDGMSADEYAYEHETLLTKTIADRYGLIIDTDSDEPTVGGFIKDRNWTEASAEQISGLLYSSDLVRFYNESDNGTNGSENLSRILVEAVKESRAAKAA